MGLERVRIALVRGFDIPRGPMREDALDWVKEQEDRRERRHHIIMVATIAAAIGAWLVGKKRRQIWRGDVRTIQLEISPSSVPFRPQLSQPAPAKF